MEPIWVLVGPNNGTLAEFPAEARRWWTRNPFGGDRAAAVADLLYPRYVSAAEARKELVVARAKERAIILAAGLRPHCREEHDGFPVLTAEQWRNYGFRQRWDSIRIPTEAKLPALWVAVHFTGTPRAAFRTPAEAQTYCYDMDLLGAADYRRMVAHVTSENQQAAAYATECREQWQLVADAGLVPTFTKPDLPEPVPVPTYDEWLANGLAARANLHTVLRFDRAEEDL